MPDQVFYETNTVTVSKSGYQRKIFIYRFKMFFNEDLKNYDGNNVVRPAVERLLELSILKVQLLRINT